MVKNCRIEFMNNEKPKQNHVPHRHFNSVENSIIDQEITKLLQKQVIIEVLPHENQFISPIFLRQKKNGDYRLILNLKDLNTFIPYRHFKMETFENAISLIRKDMFMASLDIRHAYYSVRIAEEDQIYLRFVWRQRIYQFTCCPNGISHGPLWFTKLMKPVYANLRNIGHISTGFIDDSLLGGLTEDSCYLNLHDTISLMVKLGFILNFDESVLKPTKVLTFLGNVIDSEKMIVYLPKEKKLLIISECKLLCDATEAPIRQVAKVIGLMVASFSAVEFGKLFYRELEMAKIHSLEMNRGNYDAKMTITSRMKSDLEWWIENVDSQVRVIDRGKPELTIQTDSSKSGWGFKCRDIISGGRWTSSECLAHINVLELKAILFSICALKENLKGKHIKILSDSSTAICYVKNMGGCKSVECNLVSKQIWQWCLKNDTWITIAHIPGSQNDADKPSRNFNDNFEWELNGKVFDKLCNIWSKPTVDLFASRLNFKVEHFCSYKPDPQATYIDAFSLDWGKFELNYIFPPFSMISRCICKIQKDQAKALLIVPLWSAQPWFPGLLSILIDYPRFLRRDRNLITMPHTNEVHPLWQKLVMIGCLVSGDHSAIKDFHQKLPAFYYHHGEHLLDTNTNHIYQSGYYSAVNGKLVKFLPA